MKYHTILNFEHNRFLGMIQLGRYGELTSLRLRTYIHLTFLQNEKLCDITFLCGDKEIHAHRAVLCANSEYFQCMFNNGMMETSARHVPIKGKTFSFTQTQGNILISCICKMQLLVFLKRKEIFCFLGYYRYDFFGAVLTKEVFWFLAHERYNSYIRIYCLSMGICRCVIFFYKRKILHHVWFISVTPRSSSTNSRRTVAL